MFTAPRLKGRSPERILNKVVLPAPEGPEIKRKSPCFKEKVIFFSAQWVPKEKVRCLMDKSTASILNKMATTAWMQEHGPGWVVEASAAFGISACRAEKASFLEL